MSVTLVNYPSVTAATATFTIEIVDYCAITTLSFDPLVTNMLAYISLGSDTQTVNAIDTASTTYGAADGVTFCGPRSYSISPSTYTFLGLTSNTLTL